MAPPGPKLKQGGYLKRTLLTEPASVLPVRSTWHR